MSRRAVLLVAVPVLLVLGVVAALSLAPLLLRTTERSTTDLGVARALVVDGAEGRVDVVAGAGPGVRVQTTESWTWSRPTVTSGVRDGTATVTTRCTGLPLFRSCSVGLRIVVPAGTDVAVGARAGGVSVRGTTGTVNATSAAGGVRLTDVSGPVEADSSAGRIEGTGLRSPRVQARSSAGSVRLSFAAPPDEIQATSSAGSVEVRLPRSGGPYAVDAGTSAGSTDVDVPTDPGSARRVVVRSSAGSVTVGLTD